MIDRIITWSQDVSERLMDCFGAVNILTPDEFFARIARIIEAPQANPIQALVLLAFILLFILCIVIFVILLVMNKKRRGKYSFVDTKGNTQTIKRPKQSELLDRLKDEGVSSEDLEDGLVVQRRFFVYKIAAAVFLALVAWVVFGTSTATQAFCMSCHENDVGAHLAYIERVGHTEASCVDCHESGGGFAKVTTNAYTRTLHAVAGVFGSSGGTYANVSQDACLNCHNDKLDSTTISSRAFIRMSHKEPIEARMSCLRCHYFAEKQEASFADAGMAVCIQCHSGDRASAACTTCHTQPATNRSRGPSQANQNILITGAPQDRCYDCHDPAPCDQCHGLRIPHPDGFMGKIHITESRRMGYAACQVCHREDSPTGIMPCESCHSL